MLTEAQFVSAVEKATDLKFDTTKIKKYHADNDGKQWQEFYFVNEPSNDALLTVRYEYGSGRMMVYSYFANKAFQPIVGARKYYCKDSRAFYTPRNEPKNGVWTNGRDYDYYRFRAKEFEDPILEEANLFHYMSNIYSAIVKGVKSNTARIHKKEAKSDEMKAKVDTENERIKKFLTIQSNSILSELNEDFDEYAPNMVADGWKFACSTNISNLKYLKHIDETFQCTLSFNCYRYREDVSLEYTSMLKMDYTFGRSSINGIRKLNDISTYRPFMSSYNYNTQVPSKTEIRNISVTEIKLRSFVEPLLDNLSRISDEEKREEAIVAMRKKLFSVVDAAYALNKKYALEFQETIHSQFKKEL